MYARAIRNLMKTKGLWGFCDFARKRLKTGNFGWTSANARNGG
jgi:hypothetical protein